MTEAQESGSVSEMLKQFVWCFDLTGCFVFFLDNETSTVASPGSGVVVNNIDLNVGIGYRSILVPPRQTALLSYFAHLASPLLCPFVITVTWQSKWLVVIQTPKLVVIQTLEKKTSPLT